MQAAAIVPMVRPSWRSAAQRALLAGKRLATPTGPRYTQIADQSNGPSPLSVTSAGFSSGFRRHALGWRKPGSPTCRAIQFFSATSSSRAQIMTFVDKRRGQLWRSCVAVLSIGQFQDCFMAKAGVRFSTGGGREKVGPGVSPGAEQWDGAATSSSGSGPTSRTSSPRSLRPRACCRPHARRTRNRAPCQGRS